MNCSLPNSSLFLTSPLAWTSRFVPNKVSSLRESFGSLLLPASSHARNSVLQLLGAGTDCILFLFELTLLYEEVSGWSLGLPPSAWNVHPMSDLVQAWIRAQDSLPPIPGVELLPYEWGLGGRKELQTTQLHFLGKSLCNTGLCEMRNTGSLSILERKHSPILGAERAGSLSSWLHVPTVELP